MAEDDRTDNGPRQATPPVDFVSPQPATGEGDRPFKVKLASTGAIYEVPVGKSIVTVLRENGLEVSTSCEAGICGTCMTDLIEGKADHRDFVLDEDDHDKLIIICVSRANCDMLTIDRPDWPR